MSNKVQSSWNPYVAGGLVGLLAIASVLISSLLINKPEYLGTSTTFVRCAGMIEQTVNPDFVANNAYYQKEKIKIDWQMLFVLGIFIGALGASLASKTFSVVPVPSIWEKRFGKNILKRSVGAFAGGAIAIFGVRLAGGCPSGHGLSGMMQLSVSGIVAMAGFMGGGFLTAYLVYKTKKGEV